MLKKVIRVKIYLLLLALFYLLSPSFIFGFNQSQKIAKVRQENKNYFSRNRFLPKDYKVKKPKKISFAKKGIRVSIYSRKFAQGDVAYVEIKKQVKNNKAELFVEEFNFDKQKVLLTAYPWGWRGFWAIPPNLKPGWKKVKVKFFLDYKGQSVVHWVKIFRRKFKRSKEALDLKNYSRPEYQKNRKIRSFVKECLSKKKRVLKRKSKNFLDEVVSHPRNYHYITSPFWATRIIKQYKIKKGKRIKLKNRVKIHRGLDLRGKRGEPVYALASGQVVLADKFYFEGNLVIVDHGNKIFSYYMHLDKILVKKGEKISGGTLLGLVGSTGRSTAPHLHVSLIVNGFQVDPLSFLSLPIKN